MLIQLVGKFITFLDGYSAAGGEPERLPPSIPELE
jgi:hypothetical protein